MKRVVICICTLIMVCAGCTYSNQGQEQKSEPSSVNTTAVDGYQELLSKLYISESIDRGFVTKLRQYDVSFGDEAQATQALKEWLGEGTQETVVSEDGRDHVKLTKDQTTAEASVNKNGTWVTLTNQNKRPLVTSYSAFLADSIENKVAISKFNDTIKFSSEVALEKVKKFIEGYQLNFSDYDFVIATVSKESFEAYWPYLKENLVKEGADFTSFEDQAEDLCVISVFPKIGEHRIIDSNTRFGSPEQLNITYGTNFMFAVTESGIIHVDITGVFLPSNIRSEEVEVSYDKAVEMIRNKYQETLLENPVYIEKIQIEYAPLPVQQDGQVYEERRYQPLVAVTVKEEGRFEKFYLNPLNWKEVQ